MWFVIVLVLTLTKAVISGEANEHDGVVVSTTQRAPQSEQVNDQLFKIEKQLELQSKLTENIRLLEALELQNKQIGKRLESMNSTLTHLVNQHTKISSDNRRLEEEIPKIFRKELHHFQSCRGHPRNCKEVRDRGSNASSIYKIQPESSPEPFFVFCNMDVRGGGWTYVLNRFDGSQNFNLSWTDYKNGFGNLAKEFWLGLEHLYHLTDGETNELLIELMDWELNKTHAHYNSFIIGKEREGYPIKTLGSYTGDAKDSFGESVGSKFSTIDRDQDNWKKDNCASWHGGGWWYDDCTRARLTGKYTHGTKLKQGGIIWADLRGFEYSLREVRLMIKPRDN